MEKLFTEKQIREKIAELAEIIAGDCRTEKLHIIFVLKGAFVFCADLIRALSRHDLDITVDYVIAKSYTGKASTGGVKCAVDVAIAGQHVLVVEDILDTGLTLLTLKKELLKKNPESLRFVCLLDKPYRREVDINADYVGFEIEDLFVVGYGIDYNEKYRQLPYIGAVD